MTEKQQAFPPQRSASRKAFAFIIGLTVVAMAAATLVGPLLVATEADPRMAVAWLTLFTALALMIGVGWFARMAFKGRRDGD